MKGIKRYLGILLGLLVAATSMPAAAYTPAYAAEFTAPEGSGAEFTTPKSEGQTTKFTAPKQEELPKLEEAGSELTAPAFAVAPSFSVTPTDPGTTITEGTDYDFEGNKLYIKSNTPMTISGGTQEQPIEGQIEVSNSATNASITLANVNIYSSSDALKINSPTTVTLDGENKLTGNQMLINAVCHLTIDGTGSLTINGCQNIEASGNLTVKDGNVTITDYTDYGIQVKGDLIVEGGSITSKGKGSSIIGIVVENNLIVKGGSVHVEGDQAGIIAGKKLIMENLGGEIIIQNTSTAAIQTAGVEPELLDGYLPTGYKVYSGTVGDGSWATIGKEDTPVEYDNGSYTNAVKEIHIRKQPEATWQTAQDGEWQSGTLKDAASNVYNGGTINLLRDVTVSETVTFNGGERTLDLDGHVLSSSGVFSPVTVGNVTLTVTGSTGSKIISGSAGNKGSIGLYINNGMVKIGGDVSVIGGASGILVEKGGAVEITENASIIGSNLQGFGLPGLEVRGGTVQVSGNAKIIGGESDGGDGIRVKRGTVTIAKNVSVTRGSNSNGINYGVYVDSDGAVLDAGATITGGVHGSTATLNQYDGADAWKFYFGNNSTLPKPSERTGYTFGGWYDNNNEIVTQAANGGTYTAKWTPAEQFPDLTLGNTYWFDLSGAEIPGTKNDSLPDKSLTWVPFIYAGTVDAYVLNSNSSGVETASKEASQATADNTETEKQYGYTYPHSLFIADHFVCHTVSWDELNGKGMIFGKDNYTSSGVTYSLRVPSVGSEYNSSDSTLKGPLNNEWELILNKSDDYIKNCSNGNSSWGQDTKYNTALPNADQRALRGHSYGGGARKMSFMSKADVAANTGFRPVLEIPNNATLKTVTVNLSGGSIGSTTGEIKLAVSSGDFTAPSKDGLSRPTDKSGDYFKWRGDNGTLYDPSDPVSSDVTTLTALWEAPEYRISAEPSELTFANKAFGYTEAPGEQTVTIENTGNQPITLTQPVDTEGKYAVGTLSENNLAAKGDTATFTIKPNTGLAVGEHNKTLTISGTNGVSATVDLSFTVQAVHSLTFNTNGGNAIESVTKPSGTTVNLSDYVPTRTGYSFTGWYSDSGLTQKVTSVVLDGDETVYAGWKIKTDNTQYTLTFNTNGGSSISSVSDTYGTSVDLTLDKYIPTREGYTFSGWYTDEKLTDRITSIKLYSSQTIYAGWTPIPTATPTATPTPTAAPTTAPSPDTDTSDFNPSIGTKFNTAKAVNGTAKVTLSWKKVKGADGYQIYWYNRKTEKYERMKTVLDAKVTTYTTRNLTYGRNHYFKIRAFSVNKKGDRTYGKFGSSVKIKTGPAATTAKTVKSTRKQQVTVTWKKVSYADGYQIYRSTGKNGTYTKMTTTHGNKAYTKTLKNQKSGKKYYYKVRAYVIGTDGKRIYGKFSTPKSVKIK